MKIDHCQEDTTVSKVKVEENGRKAVFRNSAQKKYKKTRIDGCVMVQTSAADWIVTKIPVGDVIIELKGKDVHHAVSQIHATARFWHKHKLFVGKIAALIVCKQYPRASTAVQRSQSSFAKTYRGPLHVVTKNYEYEFERVLSFEGPH
jgi:hypothetical protein